MKRPRVPSAALVMGLFAGLLAAVTVLPTAAPLISRVGRAESELALYHVDRVALVVSALQKKGPIQADTFHTLGVDHLSVTLPNQQPRRMGQALPEPFVSAACAEPDPILLGPDASNRLWATACVESEGARVVAAWIVKQTPAGTLVTFVALLALLVGIVTALGVLRMLAPIGRVSRALKRVSHGERGVRLETTGLAELDELVERLNETASAMDGREEEVVGRIQAMDQLTRMVAHEVRNPLQSLELLTSLIASEEDPTERRAIARSIHDEIHGLDQIVQRLLKEGSLPGQLRLYRSPEDLYAMVASVVSLRRREAEAHGVRLELENTLTVPAILMLDRPLFSRSVENLLLNAMQFIPPHGLVRVRLTRTEGHHCLHVEDNGPGVDPDLEAHIFDANVSGRTGGTGLGLALVRAVVIAHDGQIEVGRSALGGAHFTIRLPMGEET